MELLSEIVICFLFTNLFCRGIRKSIKNEDCFLILFQFLSIVPILNIFSTIVMFVVCLIESTRRKNIKVGDILFGKTKEKEKK